MAVDITRHDGIDPKAPVVQTLLSNLQGNILSPHGRMHSAYLFVTFQEGQSQAIRNWISDFATNYVTTAKEQEEQAERYRKDKVDGGLFGSFYLSYQGYRVLGIHEDQIPHGKGNSFARGMKEAKLHDPEHELWEEGYQHTIHALIFLADTDPVVLEVAVTQVKTALEPLTEHVFTDKPGVRWLGPDKKQDIEPFGYADGISQPFFLKHQFDQAQKEGTDLWDPCAPLDLVLLKDPNAKGEDSYGSFVVFRKLEQDVAGFQQRVAELADELKIDPKLAGAYVVGRFQDGTPVVLQDHDQGGGRTADFVTNFNYANDMKASRCPFHSHVRKTNPRGDTVRFFDGDYDFERHHRIVRRGVPNGQQPEPGQSPTPPVGLYFICFQSDIGNQFELMQTTWSNRLHFVRQKTGLDPISGQGEQLDGGQSWPLEYGVDATARDVQFDFSPYVELRGGEYFFAPSLEFLEGL